MSDLVKKYQHYFAESTRLQELVNEQAAYIAELEEALAALSEDYFDSPEASAASRANVKKATKLLGASSPHTKALTKLHGAMKKSPYHYGIADSELERREIGNYDDLDSRDVPASKPALTPMKGKGYDGYDAIFGGSKKGINLGVIKKAAAAIRKKAKGK